MGLTGAAGGITEYWFPSIGNVPSGYVLSVVNGELVWVAASGTIAVGDTISGADANAVLYSNASSQLATNTNCSYNGRTLVLNDADVTKTPIAPTSLNISFVANASGFLANGTIYQYTVHAYWYTGSSYAYNSSGITTGVSDPNDLNNYDVNPTWSGATDANGYLLVDDNTGYWIDVGDVTTYTVTPSTSWNTSSVPALTPNSIVEAGHPYWANNNIDYGTTSFNVMAAGLSGSNHLELRWVYDGSGGNGGLRFQDDAGNLRYINANCYGENAYFSNAVTAGQFSGYVYPTTFGANYIAFGASGGYVTGNAGFAWDATNYRALLSNTGITAQSQLHLHRSTAVEVMSRYTNSATGSASTDGFKVGIDSTGAVELRNYENTAMNFYTINTLRVTVAASSSPILTAFGGIQAQYNSLANTSTDGLIVSNLASATSGVPIQRSGRLNFTSNVWDTSASATRIDNWIIQPVLTSGSPGTSYLSFERQYNGGGYTSYLQLTSAGVLSLFSDLKLTVAGGGFYIKEGTNATSGAATLVAGTVTVSTTKVTASSRIQLTIQSLGTVAAPKAIGVTARTAGTSFTITSADATDTSVIAWTIIEPA